jgi:hypothetical protein
VQVLLALWLYRKLPLAGSPPRPVRPAHRILGFALFAVTVPIAVHCLLAYGVQLSSARVAVHSLTRPEPGHGTARPARHRGRPPGGRGPHRTQN